VSVRANTDPRFYAGWGVPALIDKIIWLQKALAEQQQAVSDAYANGRKLGYEQGKSDGWDEAMKEARHGL
jgi:flagellar biosynthesis/type III secretory pathway protein FliH